jgi:predicted oxidoreductase (fatty acid repression mutant protein)
MQSVDVVVWLNTEQAHLYSFQNDEVKLVIDNPSKEETESKSDFHSQT